MGIDGENVILRSPMMKCIRDAFWRRERCSVFFDRPGMCAFAFPKISLQCSALGTSAAHICYAYLLIYKNTQII
jgi:hypothetical protein